MLLERVLKEVRAVEPADVDDREFHTWIVNGYGIDGVRLRKAHAEDQGCAPAHHAAQSLLALGFIGDLEFHNLHAGLIRELLYAIPNAFIEALVKFAAHVVDHGGL